MKIDEAGELFDEQLVNGVAGRMNLVSSDATGAKVDPEGMLYVEQNVDGVTGRMPVVSINGRSDAATVVTADSDTIALTGTGKHDAPLTAAVKDGSIGNLQLADEVNAKLAALQGAFVYRGKIGSPTAAVSQQSLTSQLQQLLSRAPQLGDVLTDAETYDWYFDGSAWQGMGQTSIAAASNTSTGLIRGGGDLSISNGVASIANGAITQSKLAAGVTLPPTVANCSNTDFDTLVTSGYYFGYTGMANSAMQGDVISVVEVITYSPHWIVQRQTTIGARAVTYERTRYGGTTWSPWVVNGVQRLVVNDWNSVPDCQAGDILIGSNVAINAPSDGYFTAQVLSIDDNNAYMKLLGMDYNGEVYTRSRNGGTWGSWRLLAFA